VDGFAMLKLRGELNRQSAARVREPLRTLLLDRGQVVADVAGLRPAYLSRRVELPLAVEAAALARSAVAEMCSDWALLPVSPVAVIVASELVSNVVEHAAPPARWCSPAPPAACSSRSPTWGR
jgi:hypothetical protein